MWRSSADKTGHDQNELEFTPPHHNSAQDLERLIQACWGAFAFVIFFRFPTPHVSHPEDTIACAVASHARAAWTMPHVHAMYGVCTSNYNFFAAFSGVRKWVDYFNQIPHFTYSTNHQLIGAILNLLWGAWKLESHFWDVTCVWTATGDVSIYQPIREHR